MMDKKIPDENHPTNMKEMLNLQKRIGKYFLLGVVVAMIPGAYVLLAFNGLVSIVVAFLLWIVLGFSIGTIMASYAMVTR